MQRHRGSRAEDRSFRSAAEVVGQKDRVFGRQVVPDEVSRICQDRGEILVEGLHIPYIDQPRSHGLYLP